MTAATRAGVASGAVITSSSAILLGLAAVGPATATAARCLLALPVVAILAWFERRSVGGLTYSQVFSGLGCGVLFAADLMFWTQAIPEVGAGLSTVIANAQVAIVPFLAWFLDGERIPPRFLATLPVIIAGVIMAGGVLEHGTTTGSNPVRGTVHCVAAALCYSGFVYLLRRGGQAGQPVQGYALVLAAATVVSATAVLLWPGSALSLSGSSLMWIVAASVSNQIIGWLLIAVYAPRLASGVSSVLLLLTPVAAIALSAWALGEYPSSLQLTGCALLLGGAYVGTRVPMNRRELN